MHMYLCRCWQQTNFDSNKFGGDDLAAEDEADEAGVCLGHHGVWHRNGVTVMAPLLQILLCGCTHLQRVAWLVTKAQTSYVQGDRHDMEAGSWQNNHLQFVDDCKCVRREVAATRL